MAAARKPSSKRTRRSALRASAEELYRSAILDAAERVLARDGFQAAKMADIAREAGVAAGTPYNYFDSKSAIVSSLLEKRAEEHFAQIEPIARGPGDPLERLRQVIDTGLRFLDQHRAMFTIFVERGEHLPAQEIIHCHQDRQTKLYERLMREAIAAGQLRDDLSPADHAAFLIGAVHGFVHGCAGGGTKKRLEQLTPLILDLFLNGTGAHS